MLGAEKPKTEFEGKIETEKAPPIQESSEIFKHKVIDAAKKEVYEIDSVGQYELESLERRAALDDLSIENEDMKELAEITQVAKAIELDLAEKLSENKSTDTTVKLEDGSGLRDFTKRYASFKRSEVASQIWQMRKEYQEKKKEVGGKKAETEAEKARLNKELELAKAKAERIEKVIAGMEKDIQEQKSKIWYKFTNLFKKEKLDDEKILEIAQEKLGKAKEDLQEKETMLEEAGKTILESVDLEKAKTELENFYHEQGGIKNKFEEERDQRDLAKISKEKGVTFVHGIPLDNLQMNNTSENNTIINTEEVDAEAKIKMILGLEPTLSTSTINEKAKYNKGMMYPFGVILKSGTVTGAYQGDAFTKAESLYARKSKDDKNLDKSIIQGDISKKIENAIDNPLAVGQGSEDGATGMGYNEIIVENPKVSGLYVNLENNSTKTIDLSMIKNISEQLGLPVFGLRHGKMFDLINGGREISPDEVSESKKDLSPQEKLAMAEESIETVFSSTVPLEAKKKILELRKEANSLDSRLLERNSEAGEINLLDAKGIEHRWRIANWAEKVFSSGESMDSNDLIKIANEQLKGDAPVAIETTFGGKTKEECMKIIKKFYEDYDKIDTFFDKKIINFKF